MDHTAAEDIAAIFNEQAAPVIVEHFHADRYEIKRKVYVSDGRGGRIATDSVAESGRCRLDITPGTGTEGVSGGVVTATSTYTVEMPRETVLEATDTLTINERTFEVVEIRRGGEQDMFTVAGVEERS